MHLKEIRLNSFKSFGPSITTIQFDQLNFLIGSNGSGKTVVLEALSRLFAFNSAQRRVLTTDFHLPLSAGEEAIERKLWIECDFSFPELNQGSESAHTIPPNFKHLRVDDESGEAVVRYRLEATLHLNGDVEEKLLNVIEVGENGEPKDSKAVSYVDRNYIHVHYLPARRDPSEHIAFTAKSLIGRVLRSGHWEETQELIGDLTRQIGDTLGGNGSVSQFSSDISEQWGKLHSGSFFKDPTIAFQGDDINTLMRLLSISFSPGHGNEAVDFNRLSDGEKSLLYFTLVLSIQDLGRKVLSEETDAFDPAKLAPPIYTIIAVEEPENSLAPHYLGRVLNSLKAAMSDPVSGKPRPDLQVLIATHSPSILSRAEPSAIRHLRIDQDRRSQVRTIKMPSKTSESHKFVREAIQAYPELYFARLVVFGEGDSEEIVLSRLLKAHDMDPDQTGISIVPLGGRHVNHFWRLLTALEIPHITLLDLDLARFGGGWGRIKYASAQLLKFGCNEIAKEDIIALPTWKTKTVYSDNGKIWEEWLEWLETQNVFFSNPLDLDFCMIETLPEAYDISEDQLEEPNEQRKAAVLGKTHSGSEQYTEAQLSLFDSYHNLFKLGSKPSAHLSALGKLKDAQLRESMPVSYVNMITAIKEALASLPE